MGVPLSVGIITGVCIFGVALFIVIATTLIHFR